MNPQHDVAASQQSRLDGRRADEVRASAAYFAELGVPEAVLDGFSARMRRPRSRDTFLLSSGELDPSRLAVKTAALEGVLHMRADEVRTCEVHGSSGSGVRELASRCSTPNGRRSCVACGRAATSMQERALRARCTTMQRLRGITRTGRCEAARLCCCAGACIDGS